MKPHDPLRTVLDPGEKLLVSVERNLLPYWMMLAVAGMGFIVYGMSDPIFGWSTMFLGTVVLAAIGGAITSIRYHVTDRRVVRTGYLGTKVVPLRGARVERRAGPFGDLITVENGRARLRIRHVKNGDAVVKAVAP